MMRNVDFERIGKIVKPICKGVAYGMLLSLVTKSYNIDVKVGGDESKFAGYSDAVEVIINSSMLGSDKAKVVKMLKRTASSEYYKSVICIVKDNSMLGSTKVQLIEDLSV